MKTLSLQYVTLVQTPRNKTYLDAIDLNIQLNVQCSITMPLYEGIITLTTDDSKPRSQLSYCKIQKLVENPRSLKENTTFDVKSRSSWYCPSFLYSFHISSVSWFKIFETEPHFTSCKRSCSNVPLSTDANLIFIAEHDIFFKIWKSFGKDPVQRAYITCFQNPVKIPELNLKACIVARNKDKSREHYRVFSVITLSLTYRDCTHI